MKTPPILLALAALGGVGVLTANRAIAAPQDGAKPTTLASPDRQAAQEQGEKEGDEGNEAPESAEWQRPTTPKARISPLQAMTAAKAKLGGGTAFSSNFEFDEGHWVYGVMVVKGHQISEIEVDPDVGEGHRGRKGGPRRRGGRDEERPDEDRRRRRLEPSPPARGSSWSRTSPRWPRSLARP